MNQLSIVRFFILKTLYCNVLVQIDTIYIEFESYVLYAFHTSSGNNLLHIHFF